MSHAFADFEEFFGDEEVCGQIPDLFVGQTDARCWRRFFEIVRAFPHEFSHLGMTEMPVDPIPLVDRLDEDGFPDLTFDLSGLSLRVCMFGLSTIDMDFDRREMDAPRFEHLLRFMRDLSRSIGRNVFVKSEYSPAALFLYEPSIDRFRRPLRGLNRSADARARILADARAILEPLRGLGPVPDPPDFSRVGETLQPILDRLERQVLDVDELALQDHLTEDERSSLNAVWSVLASVIYHPAPGLEPNPAHRLASWRELPTRAKHLDAD
jgi:hypothetical protein